MTEVKRDVFPESERAGMTRARNGVVPRAPIDRLRARLRLVPATGCLEWTGALDAKGYARIAIGGKRNVFAHRLAYEAERGPIPDGLTLDHLCRNAPCCNPDHLEPVTREENSRRGYVAQPRLTHCRRGHLFTPENEVMNPRGRTCRTCKQDRDARYRTAARS